MELYRALQNVAWRMEAISPTHTAERRGFKSAQLEALTPDTVRNRVFHVDVESAGPAQDLTDGSIRTAGVDIIISVYYPTDSVVPDRLYRMILPDLQDVVRTIEDPELYVGYSDAASSDDIGIMDRQVTRSPILQNEGDGYWTLQIAVQTLIKGAW